MVTGKYGKNDINKSFNKKYQMLQSYILKFKFRTDSGILNYLNNKEFILDNKFDLTI
ncbi:MAG: hypothetical protein U0L98_04415 [Clostridia bacterium]|nr:hypothetical protein [Clostridia bacterium]